MSGQTLTFQVLQIGGSRPGVAPCMVVKIIGRFVRLVETPFLLDRTTENDRPGNGAIVHGVQ